MIINRLSIYILLTLFSELLLLHNANSQNKCTPGTLINLENKPVDGSFLNIDFNNTPIKIFFKESNADTVKTYTAHNSLGFKTDHGIFFRGIVKLDRLERTPDKNSSSINIAEDTVFLQALVIGPKNLYYIKKNNKEYFFYRENNHFIKLQYKTSAINPDDPKNKLTIINNTYKTQLISLLGDCPDIRKDIYSLRYRKNAFLKLFKKYYSCQKSTPGYITEPDKIALEYGPAAGISFVSKKIVSQSFRYLHVFPVNDTIIPVFGAFLDVIFPRYNKHLSIHNEMLYLSCHFKMGVPSLDHWKPENTDLTLKLHNLKLFNVLRYNLYKNSNILFFGIGISNAVNVADDITYVSQRLEESSIDYKSLMDIQKFETGLVLDAGFRHNGFGINWKFEYSNGIAPIYSIKLRAMRNYLLLSYSF